MTGVLDQILASKRAEVEAMRARAPSRGVAMRTTLDVTAALKRPGALALIAEVKKKSPSAGALSRVLGAGERAVAYAQAGAALVSVLCDGPFFDGSYEDVAAARAALDAAGFSAVPILAKEFVIDPVQVERAREAADAVLVIARVLRGASLGEIVEACRARSIEAFIEVADEDELSRALDVGARIIGVNTRDLDTLAMDAARTARVVERIPEACVAVHLSGLRAPEDIAAVAKTRADAALIGEALMREDDPGDLLKRMLAHAAK
jgi:indole-3-glycerol phosphate synthase